MGNPSWTKNLAKQRAKKDVDVEVESGYSHELRSPEAVKRYEAKREAPSGTEMATAMEKAEGIDRRADDRPDDLDDHASKLKRKKFKMMQSLLKDFDDLDGNGIPDSQEK